MKSYDIVIIGAGILGVSLAYMLSLFTNSKIIVIEKELKAALHASSRNSGKVHAPFIYDPRKRKISARLSYLALDMIERYTKIKGILFKKDGVLEVALDDHDINILEQYIRWGEENGLSNKDLILLERRDIKNIEPEVNCVKALYCKQDGSINYKDLTTSIAKDAEMNGVTFMFNKPVEKIKDNNLSFKDDNISYKFLINAAGGNSIDIAHKTNTALEFTDLHFKGEYWRAPEIYNRLTKISVYAVPKYMEYPFLDPHWLVRAEGFAEIGPNALPVFGPYAYSLKDNLKVSISKIIEMLNSSARNLLFDKEFITLVKDEIISSLSKRAMIKRVKRFLPRIEPHLFNERGFSGIRSLIIDRYGKFVSDPIIILDKDLLHILNYNSPGATAALPFSLYITMLLQENGIIKIKYNYNQPYWDLDNIIDKLPTNTII